MRAKLLLSRFAQLVLITAAGVASPAAAQPALSPQQALARFKVAPGYEVELFASEPSVRQPVTMTFDDRGRLWVIQYLQYPNPAGLTPVQVDQYLRTKYDRVPEPPPHGPKGADRITILEDTDGDGRADSSKDFVTGLNLASALAIGHGGVFIGQAPYLLFYPDRNGDDVPDGDPEVLLEGFGLEDAHAVVNSMQWGPDGWLYGAQGSTVTANIRDIEFQQGIWRYHPVTKRFELFAEGGGNTWGLDFDRHGNVIAGTNWGEKVLLHQVQGGYYVKGFAKHGPLHNPYTYGYFEHAPHDGWRGGHVTCGGIVYQGDNFPAEMRGKYVAANLLSNVVYWHDIIPHGSTFKTKQGGELLSTDDVWFRPIDCLTGPDGAVYVADWYDVRANHVIPEDTWDKSSGRIWRIKAKGAKAAAKIDLTKKNSSELVGLLAHPNDWFAREARRILAERQDLSVVPVLEKLVSEPSDDRLCLQAVWTLHALGGLNAHAEQWLAHRSRDIRSWAVRLIGDEPTASAELCKVLTRLAETDTDVRVRSQLASTAKRLPATAALPIVGALLQHDQDVDDPFLPLLLWWAIEDKAVSDRALVLNLIENTYQRPLVDKVILERLVRRYTAENSPAGYESCAQLFALASSQSAQRRLIAAMEQELAGKRLEQVPAPLAELVARIWSQSSTDSQITRWAVRLGSDQAYRQALAWATDEKQPDSRRIEMISLIAQVGDAQAKAALLGIVKSQQPDNVRLSAIAGLERYDDMQVAGAILEVINAFSPALRQRAIDLLCARPESSAALLDAMESGQIDAQAINTAQLRRIVGHGDAQLIVAVEKRWGKIRPATPGEKQAMIVVLNRTLSEAAGDKLRGKPVFAKHCANCHTLFGEGSKVGPDLTSADRRDRAALLLNIVDPGSTIRPEFVSQTLSLHDGRIMTGLVTESTSTELTLVDSKAQKSVIPRADIDQIKPAELSLMPEKLLESLSAAELRDLFAYLQATGPIETAKAN